MELEIRKARVADIGAIYRMVILATRRGKILKRSMSDLRKSIRHFWVAEVQGAVVACCSLEIYNKKLAEIRSLTVDAGMEEKGIASRLVEHCLREARRKKIYEVLVITNRENIFRRHGFSEQLHDQKALFIRP